MILSQFTVWLLRLIHLQWSLSAFSRLIVTNAIYSRGQKFKGKCDFFIFIILNHGESDGNNIVIFAMQKDRFGGFEKGHSFKKPRDYRGLELAKL